MRLSRRLARSGKTSRRAFACTIGVVAACAAPGVAQAHGGGAFLAGSTVGPAPTVDGVVSESEWADAKTYEVVFPGLGNGKVRFVHTATDLYVGVRIEDPSATVTPQFDVFFDNDHDGAGEAGDDAWLSSSADDFYLDTGLGGFASDVGNGGTDETEAAGPITSSGVVTYEVRHPLCSADTAHDICTSAGNTLGIDFQYTRGAGAFVNAPGSNLLDPSSNWADLAIMAGDVVEPSASVTAPTVGAVLRGTVPVAAQASDNAGVTAVDFEYFDGATDTTVNLGTDNDPPYTGTFDSTQVPNTAPANATLYAIAHDAAGNTTKVGTPVTVDNTQPSRIVFESTRDGNSEIYRMNADGTNVTRLTNSAAVDTRPTLSPDGTLVAWQSANQIWVMSNNGDNKQALTSLGTNAAPAWSPDGTKIAFESNRSGDYDIWVMNADGTAQTNLTNTLGNDDVSAAWSPNGSRIAFDSDRTGNRDVFTMLANGTDQTNLTAGSVGLDADPEYSPDGARILFVSDRGSSTSVWTMDTAGGGAVDVTSASIYDADPAWSPDGTHVVFTRDAGGQTFNLWTARADGTAQLQLTNAAGGQRNSFPDWGSRPAEQTVTLEPVADTFVRAGDPATAHGTATTFDVYAGASTYCGDGPGPAYGLLRFNLSSLPPGVRVTNARLDLSVAGGFAFDGDPSHYAIRLNSNDWPESVTWNTRPADGIVPGPVGPPFGAPTINGVPLSSSLDVLGIGNAFNNNCSTNSGGPPVRSFSSPSNRPENFAKAVSGAIGTGALSLEVWSQACGTPTTVPCQSGGSQKAYFLRYYSREAAPELRPKLVVTYTSSVDLNSFTATPVDPKAGLGEIAMADVPPSVLLSQASSATGSTPLGDTPLGDTPLGDTPLGDTPLGDTPLGDTSLGLAGLITELRTVSLTSLPLLRDGGWQAVIASIPTPNPLANRALQNVTLGDVLAVQPRPPVLDGQGTDDITLADLDFSHSSLGDVVALAYALGNGVTLSQLSGAFTNGALDADLQNWCTVTGTTCNTTGILALGIRGAPLGDTPLGDTPLGDTAGHAVGFLQGTPLGDTPLGDTPLGDTPLGDTPLGDTPLGDTAFAGTPLGDTPLGDTNVNQAPLGDTPLGDTPLGDTNLSRAPLGDTPLGDTPLGDTPLGDTPLGDTLVSAIEPQSCTTIFTSCPPPNDTLDQHFGDLQPNITIAQLVAALTPTARQQLTLGDLVASLANPNAFTVAQLLAVLQPPSNFTIAQVAAIFRAASGVTLADLVASLPNPQDFTLNDLVLAVLRAGAQWERIDLNQPALARVATGGGALALTANVTVHGASALTFTVNLPHGWTTTDAASIETLPQPGAISVLDVVDVTATANGTRMTLRTQFPVNGDLRFSLQVKPGITLGPAAPSLAVAAADGTPTSAPAETVDVQETFEPNNDPATAPLIAPGKLYVSYLTTAADSDFFRVTVPPAAGTRTTIRLSHLPKDYDLVVYGRQGTTPLVGGGAAPPLETPVLGDSGAPVTHLNDALPAETLDDLTLLSGRPVLGVSAFRTTEDEAVVAISDGVPGDYIVQVTGYNHASSVLPYMLRVESEAPRQAPACPARYADLDPVFRGARPGINVASIPADTDTLFLANGLQLGKGSGAGALDWFSTATTHLTSLRTLGHPSALVRLEDNAAVASAYADWNAQPCNTARANAVVSAITDVVRTIRTARPSVRNIVLIGNDTALPFARLDDLTTVANEAGYASTFQRSEDPYGSLFEHRMYSDDPYATTDPIPNLQRQLYVPQLAVGRLVENSAQITGALDRYLSFSGRLAPTSARTSGYDFLQDGASGVASAFASIVGAQQPTTNPPLIGNLWTSSTLSGALSTTTGLFGMNGHADHQRLQPAAGSALFTAADLPASLQRAVIFSMGCHSALSASDAAVAGAAAADWPQTYADKGAAAYAGNLGYGYGDTIAVAYSEALNVRLAQGLRDGLAIGDALVRAKQGYFANSGLIGVYDEKAMSELALYGLPMWSLGTAAPATTPALPAGVTQGTTDPDPITGLMVDHYRSQPTLNRVDRTTAEPKGTYWTGPSGLQVTHLRPLQPKVEFDVAPDAHGLLITGLTSMDFQNINPIYARPLVDNSADEPELPFADVAFPAKIQTLVSQQTRTGLRNTAVLVHGQFFSNSSKDADGDGTERRFDRVDVDVLRSNGNDRIAPRFDSVDAVVDEATDTVSFSVDVVDLPTESAADVKRVLVAFRDETSPTWRFLDLSHGTAATWGATAPVTGTSVEYFVQAVDRFGNVAVTTNKARLFAGAPPAPPSGTGVTPSITGTKIAGWFTPEALLTVQAGDGIAVSTSIDGGTLTPFSGSQPINTDGLHVIGVRGSNGYQATLFAPVDVDPPTVALDQPGQFVPVGAKIPLAFRCGDTASGIDASDPNSCSATIRSTSMSETAWANGTDVPASPLGQTYTVRLRATDRVGHQRVQEFTYEVRARGIVYSSSATGSGDIYVLPPDAGPTTPPTRLTATSFPEADPVWSPDSRRIAFASNRTGTWQIYLMDADGTDVKLLNTGTGDATQPAWSPDGNRIAFVSTRKKNSDIWIVNLDGTGLRQLTTDTKEDVAPTWSPSATSPQIMWSNGPGGQLDLWRMPVPVVGNPGTKVRITTTEDLNTEAAWRSDGTVAFARRAKGGARFEIWTIPATGGTMKRIIVSNVRNDTQPTWLQDGRLVFATDRDDERDFDLFRARPSPPAPPAPNGGWPVERITNAPGDDRAPNG